jgi:adenylylsulfate kinase
VKRKILIMGLPGAGKTTLAKLVAKRLNAVHFNADDIRSNVNRDLGFSEDDRIEQARRMGWLCDRVVETGCYAVADFICPTVETRAAFFAGGPGITVFMDRIEAGRFEDTNKMFVTPTEPDIHVKPQGSPDFWCERVAALVRPVFRSRNPTALMLGRYQPFHDGHKALAEVAIGRHGQVCIAVRDMQIDPKNPYSFEEVKARIDHAMREHEGKFTVVSLPDIASILYGRDVGYSIERVELGEATEAISATAARARLAG